MQIELVDTAEFSVLELSKECERSDGPLIVFSAHGDTCYGISNCSHVPRSRGGLLFGHVDNAGGVFALMKAFFSGNLPADRVQCKVTYGEERAVNGVYYAGARDVMVTLSPADFVAVIDVTGTCSRAVNEDTVVRARDLRGHVIIEKVRHNQKVLELLRLLKGRCTHISGYPSTDKHFTKDDTALYTYEIYHFCNDPQAFEDETDAYGETQQNTVFLGLQTCGGTIGKLSSYGDYNAEPVFVWQNDIDALAMIIVELANAFISPEYQKIYSS